MNYSAHLIEDLRLAVLLVLARGPAFTASSAVLRTELPVHGHRVAGDVLRVQTAWLDEQGLTRSHPIASGGIARSHTLTDRGLDTARGIVQVPGVRQPTPDELPA